MNVYFFISAFCRRIFEIMCCAIRLVLCPRVRFMSCGDAHNLLKYWRSAEEKKKTSTFFARKFSFRTSLVERCSKTFRKPFSRRRWENKRFQFRTENKIHKLTNFSFTSISLIKHFKITWASTIQPDAVSEYFHKYIFFLPLIRPYYDEDSNVLKQ